MSASTTAANAGQRAAWNGDEGAHWARHAKQYEASTVCHRNALWAAVEPAADAAVIDVGCGTGASTLEVARRSPTGRVLGVDLSQAMLDHARGQAAAEHLENVTFLQADAQTHSFAAAGADLVISCFAAMFFDDPRAAFTNLAVALRPGGALAALAWQGLDGNEWLQCIRGALLAGRDLPPPPPGRPGPFGLSDPTGVEAVLEASGFGNVELTAVHSPMRFGADADDAFAFLQHQGVTVGMLRDLDKAARAAALDALHETLQDHETADGVSFASAAWLIQATR